jgi:hypothetical protein
MGVNSGGIVEIGHAAFSIGHVLLKLRVSSEAVTADLQSRQAPVDERVILHKAAKYWNRRRFDRPDGLLVVTSHRIAFLAKITTITTTTAFLSFPYPDIKNPEATRVMRISPAIRFHLGEDPYVFTLLSGADEVLTAIQAAMASSATAAD